MYTNMFASSTEDTSTSDDTQRDFWYLDTFEGRDTQDAAAGLYDGAGEEKEVRLVTWRVGKWGVYEMWCKVEGWQRLQK